VARVSVEAGARPQVAWRCGALGSEKIEKNKTQEDGWRDRGTQSHQVPGVNLCHGIEFKNAATVLAWDLLQDCFFLGTSLQTLF